MSDDILNQEQADTKTINKEIHMYKQKIGNKCVTIIQGLIFKTEKEQTQILTAIKKKFGIGGCYKIVSQNETTKSYLFNGYYGDKIKKYLVDELKIDEANITSHG